MQKCVAFFVYLCETIEIMGKFILNYKYTILFLLICYNASVMTYQKFSNPKLTDTELLLLIPNNWMLNFK